ncbi:DUF2383 domain-containing protein [Pelotalea chapellei]|uniref:Ferritin-like domain-containing protein n=1 Tax=Pelotalea chapellei TaxID=44671 RepID=A0ABS5UBA4_9BACT|nr:DUF2383 domain-containing protein [Pelotalea chapellei]MBT1072962.1 ferritin-like domain-containing protein [Pelotalea chapellei]
MNNDEILSQIEKLIHLDVDAYHAYEQAIKNIDEAIIREKLVLFQAEHRRHVDVLSEKMRVLGGTPPEFHKDFKGFFISGFTSLRSMTGTKGALEAMETNERLTTSSYEKAIKQDFPADIAGIIRIHLSDEQRHLSFVREAISRASSGDRNR